MFSALQNSNLTKNDDNPECVREFEFALEKAGRQVKVVCESYTKQIKASRQLLHEHPWLSKPWKLDCVQELMEDPTVMATEAHQCKFGLVAPIVNGGAEEGPARKPTGIMSILWCMIEELSKTCATYRINVLLFDWRAAATAIYPEDLCHAICRGMARHEA